MDPFYPNNRAALEARFEALVRSHRAAFERLARRLARDADDADDLLQETLVDAYRGFGRFRPDTHFYGWVARIMTNNARDRARRKQHPVVSLDQPAVGDAGHPFELPDETANPERVLLQSRLDQPYAAALETLQPLQRATVLLCDLEGASYEEAAAASECPVGTIRSRLHRAHNCLRSFLAQVVSAAGSPEPAAESARVHSRRQFLRMGTAAAAAAGAALTHLGESEAAGAAAPIRVLVWTDDPAPRSAYPEGVHAALAELFQVDREFEVTTASLRDAEQGLADSLLRAADLLVWCGGGQDDPVRPERIAAVARRVRDGRLGLITLHAARAPQPLRALLGPDSGWTAPAGPGPAPLRLSLTAPRHPIARGLRAFTIPQSDRCEGEFSGPRPDILLFEGTYPDGARAAQGLVWSLDRGRLFCFRPGDPSLPIYRQEEVAQILRNAARWCAHRPLPGDAGPA